MAVQDVAHGLVALCKQGKFQEAESTYYSDDIVSVEAFGESPESRGIEAVRESSAQWNAMFEVNDANVMGPYINGDQFAVGFQLNVTNRQSGERRKLEEIGVYTVKDDRIIHQRFFIPM
jgi:hypothetical protein